MICIYDILLLPLHQIKRVNNNLKSKNYVRSIYYSLCGSSSD